MSKKRSLYLMLSRTATGMGRTIRLFTNYEYNHISLSLDPTFQNWVSFARYVQDVPLAGGFVHESAQRFLSMEGPVSAKIFRVEISETCYQQLVRLFSMAGSPNSGLIYNTFSAITTAIGFPCPLPGAYTCLDFASAILGRSFKSLREVDEVMQNRVIYQGDLKALLHAGQEEDPYFTRRGFRGGTWDTAVHFTRLANRFIHRSSYEDPLNTVLH